MHSQLRKSQLPKLQDKLRSKNEKEKELEEHNNFHKWLRELEKYCEHIGEISTSQLRACQKVRHQLTLANRDRAEKNLDDELASKFDDTKQFHIRSLDNMRFRIRSLDHSSLSGQLSIDLADSISQTKEKESSLTTASEATLQRVPQIQLCRDSFQQLALQEQWTPSSFQEAACSSSLSTKALDNTNFQDSSLTEETFRQATSQPAAWQKRASDRQLLRQQLGRRDLHKGNFRA